MGCGGEGWKGVGYMGGFGSGFVPGGEGGERIRGPWSWKGNEAVGWDLGLEEQQGGRVGCWVRGTILR